MNIDDAIKKIEEDILRVKEKVKEEKIARLNKNFNETISKAINILVSLKDLDLVNNHLTTSQLINETEQLLFKADTYLDNIWEIQYMED